MLQIGFGFYALARGLLPAVIAAACVLAPPVAAQKEERPAGTWEAGAEANPEALQTAQRAHLWRVAAWGMANVALGVSLLAVGDRREHPARHGFGVQSAAWGAVNIGIATVALSTGFGDPTSSLAAAIRAENAYADVLLLNLGLNVGYAGVGAALVAVGHRAGIPSAQTRGALRGHGWALVLQGAGLFALDGIAWLGSRTRLRYLVDGVEAVTLAFAPDQVGFVLLF